MSEVFTAADLLERPDTLRSLQPPARLAVLGDPIAQSKSPVFQNAALKACGIDVQYIRLHVRPDELAAALRALPGAGFLGANLTLPHKTAALETVTDLDETARAIGAVNTIAIDDDRRLRIGLYARVRVSVDQPRKTLLVPERAVGVDQGQRFVYVVNPENRIEYRKVTVGQIHDGMLSILEGLNPDDRVVTEGLLGLRPGLVVEPETHVAAAQ